MNQAQPQPRRIKPIRWILIAGGLFLLLLILLPRGSGVEEIDITQVIDMAEAGRISKIEVRDDKLTVTTTSGDTFKSRKEGSVSLLELLEQQEIEGIQIDVQKTGSSFGGILLSFLPIIIFGGLIFWMIRGARGGINQAMSIGQSKARVGVPNRPSVAFGDLRRRSRGRRGQTGAC